MEKILLHGENTLLSRQRLSQIKDGLNSDELEEIRPEKFFRESVGFFERQLFGGRRFLLMEFFEKDELRKLDLNKLSSFLSGQDLPDGLIFWFGFELPSTNPLFKNIQEGIFQATKFDISPKVFKLVDAFFEPRRSLSRLYQLLGKDFEWEKDGSFLIFMLIKRTRQLLWFSHKASSFNGLHPFVQKKLSQGPLNLGQKFRLLKLYQNLVSIEKKLKSQATDLESRFFLLYESLPT